MSKLRRENHRLRQERLEALPRALQRRLRRSRRGCAPKEIDDPVRFFEFMSAHQGDFPIGVMVHVLGGSVSGSCAWLQNACRARAKALFLRNDTRAARC